MSDRIKQRGAAIVAAVLLTALAGAAAADPMSAKNNHGRNAPPSPANPRFQYIHCATVLGSNPCAFDPAMRQLNGEPPDDAPQFVPEPAAPPAGLPAPFDERFSPSR